MKLSLLSFEYGKVGPGHCLLPRLGKTVRIQKLKYDVSEKVPISARKNVPKN